MITDDERREVAARLRNELTFMRENEKFYKNDLDTVECGNRAYRNIAGSVENFGNFYTGNYIHTVEILADLIDRPTCKIILESKLNTTYGEPINGLNAYILSCGHQTVGPEKPRYCPKCGAAIVND